MSPSFKDGVYELTFDNLTEYPDTVNALSKFNIYPEVIFLSCSNYYGALSFETYIFCLFIPGHDWWHVEALQPGYQYIRLEWKAVLHD